MALPRAEVDVVVIETDVRISGLYEEWFDTQGLSCRSFETPSEALRLLVDIETPKMILTNNHNHCSQSMLWKYLNTYCPSLPVIMITGHPPFVIPLVGGRPISLVIKPEWDLALLYIRSVLSKCRRATRFPYL